MSATQRIKNNACPKMILRAGPAVLLTVFFCVAEHSCFGDEKVYNKTVKSTVWIVARKSTGSGILIDKKNRLIVTNEHVVGEEKSVTVFFPAEVNGRRAAQPKHYLDRIKTLGIGGKVIATNAQRDIAFVQLERLPASVEAIKIGKPAQPGAEVHSIGNPGDSDALWVYTSGQVRANYYRIFSTSKRHRMQVLETQSPINPGDSGGPIVNSSAELVGISQSFSTKGRLISHGVDISEITWFLDKVRSANKDLKTGKPTSDSTTGNKTGDAKTGFATRQVDLGGDEKQKVFIAHEVDLYHDIKTRRVWSLAKSYDGKIPEAAAFAMLEQNGLTKIGGWVIEKGKDGKMHVIFLAHASVDANDLQMTSIIEYVGKVADSMRKKLNR